MWQQIPDEVTQSKMRKLFVDGRPFAHIVIDDLVIDAQFLASVFPAPSWDYWLGLGDAYQKNKFVCSDLSVFPNELQELVAGFHDPKFLTFLENITGIKRLIPDPYLEGGGLHLSTDGGVLAAHTDFHIYERLGLYRRLNLILYLNQNWCDGDGGELELSSSEHPNMLSSIEPILGRTVIFETDDLSVHGFKNPVRGETCRQSLALYFYTSAEAKSFSGDQTTHWREHGFISRSARPRFLTYKMLLKLSRGFSILAQLINPNQGIGLARLRLKQKK